MGVEDYGCGVCREPYSTKNEKRVPRVLGGCGHTLCYGCACAIARKDRRSIECPLCRMTNPLTDGTANSLKKNFALLELIERLSQKEDEGDKYAKEREMAVECDEDARHVAVLFCLTCQSNLCERCSEASHSTNVLSKHRRVPLSTRPAPLVHCPLHASYVLEFVCEEEECDTESPLMCLLCRDYGRHKGHKHTFLEKEANALRNDIQAAIDELTHKGRDVDVWLNNVDATMNELSDRASGPLGVARSRVQAHFRTLMDKLAKEENVALGRLDGHVDDRLDELSTHQRRLSTQANKITQTCSELQKMLNQEKTKLVERKEELQAMLDSARAEKFLPPGESLTSSLIPFHVGRDNRLHIGHFVDARVVVLGLDGSGKTTMVSRLKGNTEPLIATPPTIGFNVDTVHHKNFRLNMWDVGGLPKLRQFWKHYYMHTQAVLFVLDGSCVERFQEASSELFRVSSYQQLSSCPMLVAINRGEPSSALDTLVHSFVQAPVPLRVHHCDALSGAGLSEILDDLTDLLSAS